ncbi:TPA: hypothetical protein I7730_15880 [Vibrio vulnificus]|uniref:Uncharacterized protein n=1 Tax=Vibrio vulnificus TaxID=672 RepID=A0A8H9N1V3_VIBVL|nr:hypothetical protein [Vibrio vulnificus]HAS8541262.1 hypothetical protein [Vibrio vulnificus]
MSAVHLYEYVQAAHDAANQGVVERKTATNQTKCGYVREKVTRHKTEVTCKRCLRKMESIM